mgnify:CR=1 FL=1
MQLWDTKAISLTSVQLENSKVNQDTRYFLIHTIFRISMYISFSFNPFTPRKVFNFERFFVSKQSISFL